MLTRDEINSTILQTLSAETGAAVHELRVGGPRLTGSPLSPLSIVQVREMPTDRIDNPHHRRFGGMNPAFKAVTTGGGSIVSATSGWVSRVEEIYSGATGDLMFDPDYLGRVSTMAQADGVAIIGPYPRFVAYPKTLAALEHRSFPDVELIVGDPGDRFDPSDWPNGLTTTPSPDRQTKAVSFVRNGSEVIGLASIFADSAMMWQIGLDVKLEHRGKSIGTAMTAQLARFALENSAVAYYGAAPSNLPSIRTAISAGMKLAWQEVFSVAIERV